MQRRIVLIESEAQRRIVDEAKVIMVPPVSHGTGSAPPKYRKLRGLCQRSGIAGIEEALFPRVERYRDADTAQHAGSRDRAERVPASGAELR